MVVDKRMAYGCGVMVVIICVSLFVTVTKAQIGV